MRVLFIWLAIIACGVANGYFFSDFGWPENLVFVLCMSFVCVFLLLIHRRITKDWKASDDPWTEGFHFPYFRISLFFSVFILIMLFIVKEATTTGIVACVSVAIASFIAHLREREYTQDWIWEEKISLKKEGSWFSYLFLIR